MAYGSVEDVKEFIRGIGVNVDLNPPDDTAIDGWLTSHSNLINGYIRAKGTTVPITDADLITVMDLYVNMITAALVVEATYNSVNYHEKAQAWRRIWDRWVKQILIGDFRFDEDDSGQLQLGYMDINLNKNPGDDY